MWVVNKYIINYEKPVKKLIIKKLLNVMYKKLCKDLVIIIIKMMIVNVIIIIVMIITVIAQFYACACTANAML